MTYLLIQGHTSSKKTYFLLFIYLFIYLLSQMFCVACQTQNTNEVQSFEGTEENQFLSMNLLCCSNFTSYSLVCLQRIQLDHLSIMQVWIYTDLKSRSPESWRDDSIVKITGYSSRVPGFNSHIARSQPSVSLISVNLTTSFIFTRYQESPHDTYRHTDNYIFQENNNK